MRNKNLYFITAILMLTIMFIFPIKIEAKTYVATREPSMIIEKEILEPGDVIDFSNSSYPNYKYSRYYIYLENELITDNCFGVEDTCLQQFVVEEKMIFQRIINGEESANLSSYGINFYKLKSNEEIKEINITEPIYWQDNYVDEHYYKSGDIIKYIFNGGGRTGTKYYIYDNKDNIIDSYNIYNNNPAIIRLPEINDKDVYWKHFVNLDTGVYKFPVAILRPIEYTEPKIELKCDKDKINYGEKTRCEVYLESPYKMSNLNFLINHNHLKLSNISYLDGVTNSGNDNQIMKLSFDDNNSFIEKKVIMTFDVEGTKDSSYLDNISLENIEYTDEVVTAKYENLNSDLNILSTKPLTNPETGMKALFVVIPIFILLIVSGMSTIGRKKHEK